MHRDDRPYRQQCFSYVVIIGANDDIEAIVNNIYSGLSICACMTMQLNIYQILRKGVRARDLDLKLLKTEL